MEDLISELNIEENLLNNGWFESLDELQKYLPENLAEIVSDKENLRPEKKNIFNAFSGLKPQDLKVLIIGQDPYPDLTRAHGLAFSFINGQKAEDSLRNIFNKIKADLNIDNEYTNLSCWQKQGVMLLNTALTFNAKTGTENGVRVWKKFIDKVLNKLIEAKKQTKTSLVVMLWGAKANNLKTFKFTEQDKNELNEYPQIRFLRSSHPSNNYGSCNKGIFKGEVYAFNDENYKPFKLCNEFLEQNGLLPIDWTTK